MCRQEFRVLCAIIFDYAVKVELEIIDLYMIGSKPKSTVLPCVMRGSLLRRAIITVSLRKWPRSSTIWEVLLLIGKGHGIVLLSGGVMGKLGARLRWTSKEEKWQTTETGPPVTKWYFKTIREMTPWGLTTTLSPRKLVVLLRRWKY